MDVGMVLPLVLTISVLSLVVAALLAQARAVGRHREARDAARSRTPSARGAEAFLRRQYRTIGMLAVVAAAVIFAFLLRQQRRQEHRRDGKGTAWKITLSFVVGALCSAIAGYIGMFVSIRANIRAAAAAMTSLNKALQIALRAGAVSGLSVVSMICWGSGGCSICSAACRTTATCRCRSSASASGPRSSPCSRSSAAESTPRRPTSRRSRRQGRGRHPGGRSAQPGGDRRPGGDNVGDCAGRGADLFESTPPRTSAP